MMTNEKTDTDNSYTKKERAVNSYLLPSDISITEIADLADCTYEYARQIVRGIESGDIDPSDHADEELQSELASQMDSPPTNLIIKDFLESEEDDQRIEETINEKIQHKTDEFEMSMTPPLDSIKSDTQPSEDRGHKKEGINTDSLENCAESLEELCTQAEFYIEEGNKSSLGQYYVAQRATRLIRSLVENSDDDIVSRKAVAALLRIFEEFYYEAEFEANQNVDGAKQKKYVAYRAVTLLQDLLEYE